MPVLLAFLGAQKTFIQSVTATGTQGLMHGFDLLVVGDANPDVIVGPLTEPLAFGQREQLVGSGALTLGGSGAITACGAARLGLSVAFAGRVGDDDAGRFVRDALAERGVDTERAASPTPTCRPR